MTGIVLESREIEFGNLSALLKLKVMPSQEKFVAPNSVTVAQYHYEPSAWMRSLWFDDQVVGMVSMINPAIESPSFEEGDRTDGAYLWRLMIGSDFQGKGYGRAAMDIVMEQTRRWGYSKLYTSLVPGEGTPQPFYEAIGMTLTGRVLDKELELLMQV